MFAGSSNIREFEFHREFQRRRISSRAREFSYETLLHAGRREEGRVEKYRDYRFVFHGAREKLCIRIIDAPVINEERGAIEPRVIKTRHAASDSPGENMKRM